MLHVLARTHSLLNDFLAELRDITVQQDRLRFRKNIERIGEILALEISKHLPVKMLEIETPLGKHSSTVLLEQPVLATVLRAGISMHQGFLNYYDKADSTYIAARRKHSGETGFEISIEYIATPDLNNKILILIDPMLASGKSMYEVYRALLKYGKPKDVFFANIIGSEDGIKYLQQMAPEVKIFIADVDPGLNEDSYIMPGLGDAGDLSFGTKL